MRKDISMNTAGLPGTGIGGLFYLVAIVYLFFAEIVLLVMGKSSRKRWSVVFEQLGIGTAMVVTALLISEVLVKLVFKSHPRHIIAAGNAAVVSYSVLQTYPVLVPFALLFAVFISVQVLRLVLLALPKTYAAQKRS